MGARPLVLVDTNVIIEAVRTGTWAAITGQLSVESVEACRDEALAGSERAIPGYVIVTRADLARMAAVHRVPPVVQASLKLAYPHADVLDAGEHDLLAHAYQNRSADLRVCSPDKAAVRAAVALGLGDQLVSLEDLARRVGARSQPRFRVQFTTPWLSSFRTQVRLEQT